MLENKYEIYNKSQRILNEIKEDLLNEIKNKIIQSGLSEYEEINVNRKTAENIINNVDVSCFEIRKINKSDLTVKTITDERLLKYSGSYKYTYESFDCKKLTDEIFVTSPYIYTKYYIFLLII